MPETASGCLLFPSPTAIPMKSRVFVCLAASCVALIGQAPVSTPVANPPRVSGNQPIGPNDVVMIQVHNFPEFSRAARVEDDGTLRLPLVKDSMKAGGLHSDQVENMVAETLRKNELVEHPVVSVTVIEYGSRPITVFGAVKNPLTFQAVGKVTLMDAIIRAGGFGPDAGPQLTIVRPAPNGGEPEISFISRASLTSAAGASETFELTGGEEIRVPHAGKVFVLGDVKTPGAHLVTEAGSSSVLTAIAQSGGLVGPAPKEAYIVRRDEDTGAKFHIGVNLREIMQRKAPDIPVMSDDILYVPDNQGRKQTLAVLDRILAFGTAISTGLVIATANNRR
jgi:polysaccharide export outer membrane protein